MQFEQTLFGIFVLVIVLQPVRVFTIATIRRAPGRLPVRGAPRFRAYRTQERRRVERSGAHFHVVGLHDDAAFRTPERLQVKNQSLE